MLTYDPAKRLSAEEAFNNPWIQSNSPNTLISTCVLQELS